MTSAQAWHWLDLPIASAKAASVLRPGGRLCLIWNVGCQPDDLADALEEAHASVVLRGGHRLFRGYAANRSSDVKTGLGSEIDPVSAEPDFGAPTEKWFTWTRAVPGVTICESKSYYVVRSEPPPHIRARPLETETIGLTRARHA